MRRRVARLPAHAVRLTGGVLAERCALNHDNLFARIDAERQFADVYREEHDDWYAEPEFCGHYLETAMAFYRANRDAALLAKTERLVRTVLRYQRADGYLGTYRTGLEFGRTFSVWNQQFTIGGLLAFHEATGDAAALEGACRCADYIANHFLAEHGRGLLKCLNFGIQHSCILREMVRLLRLTGEPRYRAFIDLILRRWEESNIRLLAVADPELNPMFELGCQKGIEGLICFQGLADLYQLTGDSVLLQACENYWSHLQRTQIGLTGNGTLGEIWVPVGNKARHVSADLRPNENCVAVGWMMFSSRLFEITGDGKYQDAFERSLYNHLLGAQAIDGRDFSYYQGTYGRKAHETHPGQYSCCRYRGMRQLANLPTEMVMRGEGEESGRPPELWLNHFAPLQVDTTVQGKRVRLHTETEFPRDGRVGVQLHVEGGGAFTLHVRQPEWCPRVTVTVEGNAHVGTRNERGHIVIARDDWPDRVVEFTIELDLNWRVTEAKVAHDPHVAFQYGPLLLALDSRLQELGGLAVTAPSTVRPMPLHGATRQAGEPMVEFGVPGQIGPREQLLRYRDYATSGSLEPARDRFTVWAPMTSAPTIR